MHFSKCTYYNKRTKKSQTNVCVRQGANDEETLSYLAL